MKTGKYRIAKLSDTCFVPEYEVGFLWFKWWKSWEDYFFHGEEGAKDFIKHQRQETEFIYIK